MKKFLCLLLVFVMLFSLVSCLDTGSDRDDDDDDSPKKTKTTTTTTTKKKPVGNTPNDPEDPEDPEAPEAPEGPGASENEDVDIIAALQTLLSGYKWNPTDVIPTKLAPEYSGNLLSTSTPVTDYSSFVSVSSIPKNGFGEQWTMVVDNLSQSQIFFTVLSVVDNVSTAAVVAFNNYIDQNPSDTAHYVFEQGIYSVTIHCTKQKVEYVMEYTATLPVLGEQSVQIALSMDTATKVKNVRVQLGNANALAYTVDQNKYTFAIKYLDNDKLGRAVNRTALFELVKNSDESVTGHVYEYLTILGVDFASVADFYITNNYVTAVGNKSSGIIADALSAAGDKTDLVSFDSYVCELYSVSSGKMIGFETKEAADASDTNVATYNKIWLDLEDVAGITSIKVLPADSTLDSLIGADKIYINGKSSEWEVKRASSGILGALSRRRFDIVFKTQVFYYYDTATEEYEKIEVEVPMLFVQEEFYDTLVADIREKNDITVSVQTSAIDIAKLKAEYAAKIDLIKENKEKYSPENIIGFIGDKKIFTE